MEAERTENLASWADHGYCADDGAGAKMCIRAADRIEFTKTASAGAPASLCEPCSKSLWRSTSALVMEA